MRPGATSSGRAEILRIHERLQATTLYVTHDQVEAMAMADRIVVMRSSDVVQIGSPLDVYNHPVGVLAERDGKCVIAIGNHHVPFLASRSALKRIGSLVASVKFTERPGAQQLVHALLDCRGVAEFAGVSVNDSALHATIRVRLDTTKSVSIWKPIQLAADPLSVHLFDRETGLRLDELQRVRISANHAGSRVGRPPLVVQPCTVTPVA
jgi:ABC-type sugar transport system ATPase subunit